MSRLVVGVLVVFGAGCRPPCERGFEPIDGQCFQVTVCGPLRPAENGGCSELPRWDCSRNTVSSAADPAEPNDCPPQARSLAIDGSAIGAFGEADDLDWYFIAGAPNTVVKLNAIGSKLTVASYDADGFSRRALLDLAEPFSVGARGLFLVVRAVEQGPYRLSLERLGEDDRTDEIFDAMEAAADSSVRGTFDFPRDVDVVALRLGVASSADVQLQTVGARVDVLDANGRLLLSTDSEVRVWSDGSPLFLAVRRAGSLTVAPAPWGLAVTSRGPDDAPDNPAFASTIRTGGEQLFEQAEDADVFRIEPTPGHVYEAECLGVSYCNAELLGADGVIKRGNSKLRFRAPESAPSFLNFWAQDTGAWTWRLIDLGGDDHGDDLQNATPLAAGASMRGTLEFDGDVDAFTLSYPLGTVLRFHTPADKEIQGGAQILPVTEGVTLVIVQGARGAYDIAIDSTLTDPEWTSVPITLPFSLDGGFEFPGDTDTFVFDGVAGHVYRAVASPPSAYLSLSEEVAGRQAGGQGRAQLVARDNGPLTVSISRDLEGSYQLSISDIGVDDYSDTDALLGPVTPGGSIQGVFDWRGDVDVFLAALAPDRFYEARCSAMDCMVRRAPYLDGRFGAFCLQPSMGQVGLSVEPGSIGGVVPRTWSLELVDLGPDDHLDGSLTAVPFESSTSAMLSCHADADAFSWTVGPRQITTLRASCEGCSVDVSDADRSQRATAFDGGLTLTVGPSLQPIVAIFSTSEPTALTFTVSDGGVDDHGDSLVSATPMTPGANAVGQLQFDGDLDVFSWDLPAGGHPVQLTGAGVSGSIWQVTGLVESIGTSSLQFFAPTAGRYYVLLRGRGDYQLIVQ